MEASEVLTVFSFHLFPKHGVQFFQGIKRHLFHFYKNMHGDDFYMAFYYRLPAWRLHFSWQNHSTVMVGPGLEVLVHAGIDPILVFRNSYLAVIRGNRLCDSAKVRNGIVVDTDPVAYIAGYHSFCVEVITERQRSHEDGDGSQFLWVATVAKNQGLSSIIQFRIHAGIALNMKCNFCAVQPVCITPAKLPVT